MTDDLKAMEEARTTASDRIVGHSGHIRLIIAGPGTGKSFTFRAALQRAGGRGLALTFIRSLAKDLAVALSDEADAYTFHGFSKRLVHQMKPPGLSAAFWLYPPLLDVLTADLDVLGVVPLRPETSSFESARRHLERTMQDLDPASRIPADVLRLGTYYDAASFVDIVYRMFLFLQDNPTLTPSFPLIVVDEYQDFTRLETAFISQLGFESPLLIAGDDDQALYGFRYADADYIRALALTSGVDRFELPYCSRCTQVVVDAVNTTVVRAVRAGRLPGRLNKPYFCYLPDKGADSERYPRLIDARCSIYGYVSRYIADEIAKIAEVDIEASEKGGHPTVLVVGPGHWVRDIHGDLVSAGYPDAQLRASSQPTLERADGLRRISGDPRSNLGWRILVALEAPPGWREAVRKALEEGSALVDSLPSEYVSAKLAQVALIERAAAGETVTKEETALIAAAVGIGVDDVGQWLSSWSTEGGAEAESAGDEVADSESTVGHTESPDRRPSILCTSLNGAKGLSAEHVFVVGLVNGQFPKEPLPTDHEVCQFLVALSRTRKQCHLVSSQRYGREWTAPSTFLSWMAPHSQVVSIRKEYWATRNA